MTTLLVSVINCVENNISLPKLPPPEPSKSPLPLKENDRFSITELSGHIQNIPLHKPTGLSQINAPVLRKKATITPIPKSGDLTQIKNWRPISILPVPGKIMEKLIYDRLMKIIEDNNMLQDFQYGFRKNKSTGEAVFDFVNDSWKSFDKDKFTACMFYDAAKAFDCVNFSKLIDILRELKLPDMYIKWIHSYLTERKQRVVTKKNRFSRQ